MEYFGSSSRRVCCSPRAIALGLLFSGILFLCGCGGGGGGDGGGEGRTRETAIRMIHGSIDAAPLTVSFEGIPLQTAKYAEQTVYVRLPRRGALTLNIERANLPGDIISSLSSQFEDDTEYTLFVYGEARTGDFRIVLQRDLVQQPEQGLAAFQAVNSLNGESGIEVRIGSTRLGPVPFGQSSGFVQVASGPQEVSVIDRNGRLLQSLDLLLADRGEVTLNITGSRDLGVVFTPVYSDLD